MAAAKDVRVLDEDGNCYIPASQRADGSWRRPKKVKPGYIPQEEVPTYQSKGKLWSDPVNNGLPVGMSKEMAESSKKPVKKPQIFTSDMSNLNRSGKPSSSVTQMNKQLAQLSVKEDSSGVSEKDKKIKSLKKKLKDIEDLQSRIDRGELKNPEKNQLEKLSKRQELLDQLDELEC